MGLSRSRRASNRARREPWLRKRVPLDLASGLVGVVRRSRLVPGEDPPCRLSGPSRVRRAGGRSPAGSPRGGSRGSGAEAFEGPVPGLFSDRVSKLHRMAVAAALGFRRAPALAGPLEDGGARRADPPSYPRLAGPGRARRRWRGHISRGPAAPGRLEFTADQRPGERTRGRTTSTRSAWSLTGLVEAVLGPAFFGRHFGKPRGLERDGHCRGSINHRIWVPSLYPEARLTLVLAAVRFVGFRGGPSLGEAWLTGIARLEPHRQLRRVRQPDHGRAILPPVARVARAPRGRPSRPDPGRAARPERREGDQRGPARRLPPRRRRQPVLPDGRAAARLPAVPLPQQAAQPDRAGRGGAGRPGLGPRRGGPFEGADPALGDRLGGEPGRAGGRDPGPLEGHRVVRREEFPDALRPARRRRRPARHPGGPGPGRRRPGDYGGPWWPWPVGGPTWPAPWPCSSLPSTSAWPTRCSSRPRRSRTSRKNPGSSS